ncbi:MAG TPA: hypothetical protein VGQ55_16770, partial [Pyrinomonadaceae bacterium]|nr:hypothetical protein [Pyrinomonadaceae bacterium]
EEKILLKKLKEDDAANRKIHLAEVVKFYKDRGAFAKAFAVMTENAPDDVRAIAAQARLAGENEKELDALRTIYWKPAEKPAVQADTDVERYLDLLYANNKEELKSVTAKPSVYQLQLINFLLGKGERELAHAAIENSTMPRAWKLSRHSETSLALREYGERPSCYFCDALQFDTIGGMITQAPDKQRFLVGDDWFRLTREYGEWIYMSPQKTGHPSLYLTALTEMGPRNSADQIELGAFYLENKDAQAAAEHFRIAVEQNPNVNALASLGSAYYLAGRQDWANEMFDRAIKDAGPNDLAAFFETLDTYGLAAEARGKLPDRIVDYLTTENADSLEEFQELTRSIAHSFKDEKQKADYFRGILAKRPTDTSLAKMLIDESLITKENSDAFFERIISRSVEKGVDETNYDFKSVMQRVWSVDDAESLYDQENDYKIDESDDDVLTWQRKYIDASFARNENVRAAAIIDQAEKELHGKNARPEWLRIDRLRAGVRSGHFDEAQAERFIGITVADAVADIKPASSERFDQVLQMLRSEKASVAIAPLSESYFGRQLALGQYDNANFVGLARTFFSEGKIEPAIHLLRLMVDASSEETRPASPAEINGLELVKAHAPDTAKIGDDDGSKISSPTEALTLAADVSVEFGRTDSAIAFRSELVNAFPANIPNRLKLSELLAAGGDKKEAANLLTQMIADPNTVRADRWQAKWQLHRIGASVDLAGPVYDPYPQFYGGMLSAGSKNGEQAQTFFIDALIAGSGNETTARRELIKSYATGERQFAALCLAESDPSQRDDELLGILSTAAEQIGEYAKATAFEKQKTNGGDPARIGRLQKLSEDAGLRATDLVVDQQNTRKL